MTLTASNRPALADEITDKLRRMIHSGEWPLQQKIPAEPELMATLGVSRGTLREAIKALAHGGMLEVRRGDGTYVRATSEISGAAQRMYQDHTQEHILEVRVGLDTQAARLAARNAKPDDITAMKALLDHAAMPGTPGTTLLGHRPTGTSTCWWRRRPGTRCCTSSTSASAPCSMLTCSGSSAAAASTGSPTRGTASLLRPSRRTMKAPPWTASTGT